MAVDWPEYEVERLSGVLLRVDLLERRHRQNGAWSLLVDHLIRAVSTACLCGREVEAHSYLVRAAVAMSDWVAKVRQGLPVSSYNRDFSTARGLFALSLCPGPERDHVFQEFLQQTANAEAGPTYNARLIAILWQQRYEELAPTAALSSLEDAGLGAPWKRFAVAIPGGDPNTLKAAVDRWLHEKIEATQTHEWGPYNEVPIEISGALAVAEHCGISLKVDSNRLLPHFRLRNP